MPHHSSPSRLLAPTFLAGPWELEALVERGAAVLGHRPRWLRRLVRRMLLDLPKPTSRNRARLQRYLYEYLQKRAIDLDYIESEAVRYRRIPIQRVFDDDSDSRRHAPLWPPPSMSSAAGAAETWPLPPLRTPDELAAWLNLDGAELDWFADCRSWERRAPAGPLRHYRYRWLPKRTGGARLIESPKWRLKCLQRRVLHEILDFIPPHDAAHGFRRGRSVRSFAAPHVGQQVVIRLDLRDFFPSIRRARVAAILMTAGYPEAVAVLLAAICTNAMPADVWDAVPDCARRLPQALQTEKLYRWPHLPQGAPASPALANLAAYRLDARLAGLARAAGGRYTRYADDLTFSGGGDLARAARRFALHAAAIAGEEGFAVEHRKTRIMRRGVRQHAAGVVLNERPNVPRAAFDRLKATLTNCLRHGPAIENRDRRLDFRAHLAGRVAYVEFLNPSRGQKLRAVFERIVWP